MGVGAAVDMLLKLRVMVDAGWRRLRGREGRIERDRELMDVGSEGEGRHRQGRESSGGDRPKL